MRLIARVRQLFQRAGLGSLFGYRTPTATPAKWGPPVAIGMIVVGFVYALLRTTPHSAGVLWAEDGGVFYVGALTVGEGLSHVLSTYAGYLHVIPRLIAAAASMLPSEMVAYAYTAAAAAITSLLAVFVFFAARRHFTNSVIPFLVWFQFLALTLALGEVANTVANLHWYLDVAVFWAVFTRFDSRWMRTMAALVTVSAILSDPSAMLAIIPLAARLVIFGRRAELPWFVVSLIATVIQASAFIIAPSTGDVRPTSVTHPSIAGMFQQFSVRAVLAPLIGVKATESIPDATLVPIAIAGFVALIALLAWLVVRASRVRGFAIAAFGYSILIFAVSWYNVDIALRPLETGARYVIVPVLIVSIVAFAFVDDLSRRSAGFRPIAVGVVAVAAIAVLFAPVVDGRVWDNRADAPLTSDALTLAADNCYGSPNETKMRIDIAPDFYTFGLTCGQLRRL